MIVFSARDLSAADRDRLRDADRIVVVTADGVAEQGSHAALLAQDGPYRRLHDVQFGQAAE